MTVTFGMVWQVYGKVEIDIPDEYKGKSEKEIQNYIRDNWDKVPLPEGDYVEGSDEPDFECFEIEEEEA